MITVELTDQEGTEKSLVFTCPGCHEHHPVRVESADPAKRPIWTWNGSRDKPTFTPSLLVYTGPYNQEAREWAGRCHSFITDGRIQFLPDCSHDKAGQTVDIPECEW